MMRDRRWEKNSSCFFFTIDGTISTIAFKRSYINSQSNINICFDMPLTPEKRRRARAEVALADGRTDFKPRAPRKRNLEEMQACAENTETRVRRLSELLEHSQDEVAHQKKLVYMWRMRAYELEGQLQRELEPRARALVDGSAASA